MSRTYCGKNCEYCEELSRGECDGCTIVWQECEIANCSLEKGYEDCTICPNQSSCDKLSEKNNVPEERVPDLEWQPVQTPEDPEAARRAFAMGTWLWTLFGLSLFSVVLGFLGSGLAVVGLVRTVCSLAYGVVLLKLATEEKGYRAAGLCGIAATVISLTLGQIPVMGVIAQFVASVVTLVGKYAEYKTHAVVAAGVDAVLSGKWKTLWKVYLFAMVMMVLGIVLTIGIIGVFLALASAYVTLVLGITEIVYLYKTAKHFRSPPDLPDFPIKLKK